MACEDEVEVILDRELPDGITYVNKSYSVTEPWMLGWAKLEEKEHGIISQNGYNILYSSYVKMDHQPNLRMRYNMPFWKMNVDGFGRLKSRIIGFSQSVDGITGIYEEDLDDLYERLSGGWTDD